MRKIASTFCCILMLCGCAEHDPILPGKRTPVFDTQKITILNTSIQNLPDKLADEKIEDCPYTQDSSNVIRDGDRKIFSGFPTNNAVANNQKPVCKSGYVYAGLTTGEVVKIAPKSKKIMWIADVFRKSNLTGGASIVDIVSPLVVKDGYVYACGLGDAFCRINAVSGAKDWCIEISSAVPFILVNNVAFVTGTDNYLYAVNIKDGSVYWRCEIEKQVAPVYDNKVITVGKLKINAENGEVIK